RFRRTGRTTIGIPGYLDAGQALAFDVMSPTGPGQIIADLHVYDSMPVKTSDSTCYLENLDCLEVSPLPDLEPAREPTGVRARIPNGVSFSVSNYLAATDRVRCWQVEGAVYRAILTELPRVIAEIWIERIVGSSVHPKSYHSRFQPASGELADIFRERLETSLPKGDRMTFDVRPANDVEITNQGFWLPEAVAMPLKPAMLDAILEGKAGNPVFTDSRRPPRAF
ncbi:MAG TPA: hypothetical protein VLA09_09700, partial [Longimicrobiales bacterium]|nr:hypothetical protein [Longimicrobiales bacterium]